MMWKRDKRVEGEKLLPTQLEYMYSFLASRQSQSQRM